MAGFSERYILTSPAHDEEPLNLDGFVAAPGVYDEGLLTVFGRSHTRSGLDPWRWLLGNEPLALAATALGNVFFWSERHRGVWFLEAQRGQSVFVGKTVTDLFEEFLTHDSIREKVLHLNFVEMLRSRLGGLSFHQCYIAEPWQVVGGSGAAETYSVGDREVYWHLVGQTVKQIFDARRAGVQR